jgi:hypothetical protein
MLLSVPACSSPNILGIFVAHVHDLAFRYGTVAEEKSANNERKIQEQFLIVPVSLFLTFAV